MDKFWLIVFIFLLSCNSENHSESTENESTSIIAGPDTSSSENSTVEEVNQYSSIAVYDDSIGWGYQILNNGSVYINQPHIPAVSGVHGFKSEEDAIKTADFAIYKIENGFFPPTISKEELDSLNVLP